MTSDRLQLIRTLVEEIPRLTEGQLHWLARVLEVFKGLREFTILHSDLFDDLTLDTFGDALRVHHSFSAEPFSKDKFEYVLQKVLTVCGHQASLASKGNPGHDLTVDHTRVSLKTQANKDIRADKIWISKFMELGKGTWGADPNDLIGLRERFLGHLADYDRIFILRALERHPNWYYELVEIPKQLMEAAAQGELKMMTGSKQFPKPGYCYVRSPDNTDIYQLYFDGGTERKLQVKNLLKSYCEVHATWRFTILE